MEISCKGYPPDKKKETPGNNFKESISRYFPPKHRFGKENAPIYFANPNQEKGGANIRIDGNDVLELPIDAESLCDVV